MLSEISHTEEDKYCYDITYVESKKITQVNLFTKQKQTHRHRKQTYGYERGKGEKGRDKLGPPVSDSPEVTVLFYWRF